jgi:hypothetical protein
MPGFGPVDLWDQKKLAYCSSESTFERHRKSALSHVIPLVPLRKRCTIHLNQVHAIEVQYGTKLGTASLLTARTPLQTADAHLEPNGSQKVRDPVPHRRPPSPHHHCRLQERVRSLSAVAGSKSSKQWDGYLLIIIPYYPRFCWARSEYWTRTTEGDAFALASAIYSASLSPAHVSITLS